MREILLQSTCEVNGKPPGSVAKKGPSGFEGGLEIACG